MLLGLAAVRGTCSTHSEGPALEFFVRTGPFKHKTWSTTVCDVANLALIDVLPIRNFTRVARWLRAQLHHVKENLVYGTLDMSKTYNAAFRVVTPKATRVIDRFHVMRHAILAVDQVRPPARGSPDGALAVRATRNTDSSRLVRTRPHGCDRRRANFRTSGKGP